MQMWALKKQDKHRFNMNFNVTPNVSAANQLTDLQCKYKPKS